MCIRDRLKEAETYLEMARKADNKAPAVSVLEGDIAFARKDIYPLLRITRQDAADVLHTNQ